MISIEKLKKSVSVIFKNILQVVNYGFSIFTTKPLFKV